MKSRRLVSEDWSGTELLMLDVHFSWNRNTSPNMPGKHLFWVGIYGRDRVRDLREVHILRKWTRAEVGVRDRSVFGRCSECVLS